MYNNTISFANDTGIDIIALSPSYFLHFLKIAKVAYFLFPLFASSKVQKIGKKMNNNIYIINNS